MGPRNMESADHELRTLEQFFRGNVPDVLTKFIQDGRLDEFMKNSDIWGLAGFIGPESRRDPIGLFWNLYDPENGMHGRNVFPDRAEEWDQVLVSSLESLYHRYLVPYVPDEGTLTGHVRPDAADGTSPIVNHKILELATFLHIESISKLSLAPKSDRFRPTLQAEHPEICPASKYGIRNQAQ